MFDVDQKAHFLLIYRDHDPGMGPVLAMADVKRRERPNVVVFRDEPGIQYRLSRRSSSQLDWTCANDLFRRHVRGTPLESMSPESFSRRIGQRIGLGHLELNTGLRGQAAREAYSHGREIFRHARAVGMLLNEAVYYHMCNDLRRVVIRMLRAVEREAQLPPPPDGQITATALLRQQIFEINDPELDLTILNRGPAARA